MRTLFIVLTCLSACALHAERLQYLPNTPTTMEHQIRMSLDQSLPNLNLHLEATQTLTMEATIIGEQSDMPILQPPLEMRVSIKDYDAALTVDDHTMTFSTKNPQTSIYLAEIKELRDKPFTLTFNAEGKLINSSDTLKALMKELPLIGKMQTGDLGKNLTVFLFPLAGKDLEVGKTYTVEGVDYTITNVNDQDITASVERQQSPQEISLLIPPTLPVEKNGKESITLSSYMQGTVTWNRNNSLVHHFQTTSQYKGELALGEWSWPVTFTIIHTLP